jgi:hypothetical protein
LSGDIAPADYKTMKTEYEKKIAMLEAKLSQFTSNNDIALISYYIPQ